MLHRGASSTRRAPLAHVSRNGDENDLTTRQFGGKQQQQPRSNIDASAVTKTPAKLASTKRRALGDISNRKQSRGAATLPKRDLHPKPSAFITNQSPAKHQTPRQSSTSFLKPKATAKPSIKVSNTDAPTSNRVVTFSLPSETQQFRRQSQKLKPVLTPAKPSVSKDLEDDVPDVELPAGRLWKDEPEEEEDFSIIDQIKRDSEDIEKFEQNEYQRNLETQWQCKKRLEEELDRQLHDLLNEFDEDFNFYPSDEEEDVLSLVLEEEIDMCDPGDISF